MVNVDLVLVLSLAFVSLVVCISRCYLFIYLFLNLRCFSCRLVASSFVLIVRSMCMNSSCWIALFNAVLVADILSLVFSIVLPEMTLYCPLKLRRIRLVLKSSCQEILYRDSRVLVRVLASIALELTFQLHIGIHMWSLFLLIE